MVAVQPIREVTSSPEDAQIRVLVVVLVVAWALAIPVARGFTSASLVGLLSAPLWWGAVRRYTWGSRLMIVWGLALLNGLILALALDGPRPFDAEVGVAQGLHLVAAMGGVGLLLWARTILRTATIAAVLGASMLVVGLAHVPSSTNPWKYDLSAPLTVLILALIDRARLELQITALAALAAVGITQDSRSYAGLCGLTLVLVVVQRRKALLSRLSWRHYAAAATVGAVLVATAYSLGTWLLVNGYLGVETQQRTLAQIARGGTLISGGRPEWTGTLQLAIAHPFGFGLGAVPTYSDVWTARTGLVSGGVGSDNGYVDTYMFNGAFKLHAVIADLWAQCGVFGLLLGVILVVVVVRGLISGVLTATAPAAVLFLATKTLWDLVFSPIYTSLPWIAMAAGLLMLPRLTSSRGVVASRTSGSVRVGDPAAYLEQARENPIDR